MSMLKQALTTSFSKYEDITETFYVKISEEETVVESNLSSLDPKQKI